MSVGRAGRVTGGRTLMVMLYPTYHRENETCMFIHAAQVMKSTEVTFNSWVDNKRAMPPRSFYPATKKSKIISFAGK